MTTSLDGVSFVKASSTLLLSFDSGCSRETLDPGLPDQMIATPSVITPVEGIILEHISTGGGATPRQTLGLGLLDQTMATCGVVLPAGASFLEQSLDSGGSQGERRVPPASMTMGFGGVVLWKLDGGCMLCCVRREEEPFGDVVASMASLVRDFTSV
jgi:hypothetical protein